VFFPLEYAGALHIIFIKEKSSQRYKNCQQCQLSDRGYIMKRNNLESLDLKAELSCFEHLKPGCPGFNPAIHLHLDDLEQVSDRSG